MLFTHSVKTIATKTNKNPTVSDREKNTQFVFMEFLIWYGDNRTQYTVEGCIGTLMEVPGPVLRD